MLEDYKINVNSEIGKLEAVVLHNPGNEVENMTPQNAHKALYSDILNLKIANREYSQIKGVLEKVTKIFQAKDLLEEVLREEELKNELLENIYKNETRNFDMEFLKSLDSKQLSKLLFEGVPLSKNNFTDFLSKNRYSLSPLYNFYFMRDASMAFNNKVLMGKMANHVRLRESLIMESIFKNHKYFKAKTINPNNCKEFNKNIISVEGGDLIVAREDILVIGTGLRTSSQGIDFIINDIKKDKKDFHIIVQQLPDKPESFIHLDMVFTILDNDSCAIFEPLIMRENQYKTIQIDIKNGKVEKIEYQQNILSALKKLKMDLKPLYCGGKNDIWIQEREQWHSGTNFFAFAPGKIIGYERNSYTIDELNVSGGFEVLKATDVIAKRKDPNDYQKCVITIEGSELARGGGGARCMTMPVRRKNI